MKVVQINTTCGVGSTGKICSDISAMLTDRNIENYILYSYCTNSCDNGIGCATKGYIKLQALKSKVLGNYGFNSKKATKKMIKELDRIKPTIVHLHNLHSHDCHLGMLLEYLKKTKVKVVWTFHDCFTFTGYCPHFSMAGCDKWKTECSACVQKEHFSWFFDRSGELYNKKKKAFYGLDLSIVTPSKWLCDRVKESFLKEFPVKVINNGIDLDVFKPTESDFRQRYGIPKDKKIVLGVAFDWSARKGLDVFVELSKKLNKDKYQLVMVGASEISDIAGCDNIIAISKTQNQSELAQIYTAADVFVNPTREEVLGLTNIEANACGTPVITFKVGGSPECLDSHSGIVVEKDDIKELCKQIVYICEKNPPQPTLCRERSKRFDLNEKYMEYIELYESIEFRRDKNS